MKKLISLILFFSLFSVNAARPVVVFETTSGEIQVELFEKEAPVTVKNFLGYVEKKHYEGTIFHRVIDNFMIQGGGFDQSMKEKKTMAPIKNEATNRIQNSTGTIAMARTMVVDSATSQFFINVNDNDFLNHRSADPQNYGYAVFGKVIKGMSVVNQIKKVRTHNAMGHANVPVEPIIIKKAYVKK